MSNEIAFPLSTIIIFLSPLLFRDIRQLNRPSADVVAPHVVQRQPLNSGGRYTLTPAPLNPIKHTLCHFSDSALINL